MTGVPHPRVAPGFGLEVGPADVVDLGGEAEQPPVSVRPVGFGRRLGQAVLLGSAVEHVQRTVLDVDRLLHQGGVQDEVGGGWTRRGGGTETGLRDCLISTFHSKASTFYTKAHSIYVEQYVCELLWKTLPVASRDPKINFFSMKLCKYKYSMLEIKYY